MPVYFPSRLTYTVNLVYRGVQQWPGVFDFALAIGGEAGQGIATPGNILARLFIRRGLYLNAYNAYQSIVRGGHIFLTIRIAQEPVYTHGDKLDLLLCLNQDTMDRHLGLMGEGTRAIFNSDAINPGNPRQGVELCPIPVSQVSESRNRADAEHGGRRGYVRAAAARLQHP